MRKENVLKHYWDCAGALDSENHTHKLLKSYYMTICRKLAKSSIYMPKEKFSRNNMCRRCSSKWNESDFQMKLIPQQIAKSNKGKKQVEKLYDAKKSTDNRRALTRKQRKRAKWLRKRMMNSMEIQCELCKNKTNLSMHKPIREERDANATQHTVLEENLLPEVDALPSVQTKKKKSKRKDKTAGLKLGKVQIHAAHKPLPKKDVTQNKPTTNQQKKAIEIVNPKPNNKNIIKANALSKQLKPVAILSQPLKAKKQKKAKAAGAPKVQSNTQKQNSLLQLAALLKAKTASKSDANEANKRLKSFLK